MLWNWLKNLFWGEYAYRTYWYAFLISLPFGWRNVLIPSVLEGPFNEYLDFSLYIGDILILCTVIFILCYNINHLSILLNMFHVEHMLLITYISLSFFWSSSSILWIDGIISIFRVLSIAFIVVFIFGSLKNQDECSTWNNSHQSIKKISCSTWNILSISLLILLVTAIIQSSIGILQVLCNSSIGLHLLGESQISADTPGVAKVLIHGERHIRAYGTFLHPNVLAGFLSVTILLFAIFKRLSMFHVEHLQKFKSTIIKLFHVEHWYWLIQFILHVGLILTASKTAMFTLAIFHLNMFHVEHTHTNGSKKMFHVEHFLTALLLVSIFTLWYFQGNSIISQPVTERLDIIENHIISLNFAIGNGIGQAVHSLVSSQPYLDTWKLQPIHSIYLQTIQSIGLVGLSLLILVVSKIVPRGTMNILALPNVPRGTLILGALPIVFLLIIGIVDHYPLDIYMGNALLGLSLGTIISIYSLTK